MTVYSLEHFRQISQRDLLTKIKKSEIFQFCHYDNQQRNYVPTIGAIHMPYAHRTVFPSNYHLWNGKSIVLLESHFDIFTILAEPQKEDILRGLVEVSGFSPSSGPRKSKSKFKLFSATYDELNNEGNFGEITRTKFTFRLNPKRGN